MLLSDIVMARARVLERMAAATAQAGWSPGSVALVAVSKNQPDERIDAMLAAGQRLFGENRVQEAQRRWRARRDGVQLRLIGPLQTNKAEDAVALFDAIDSLDRPKLATALARAVQKAGRQPELLIQVNTGEEAQKAGVAPRDLEGLLALCSQLELSIAGLMCIPPVEEPPGAHFALLAKLAGRSGLQTLSMGMSHDFETAIRFGATQVRVGSALFGARPAVSES